MPIDTMNVFLNRMFVVFLARVRPDSRVAKWQNRLNPLWKTFAGGCHLNRSVPDCLAASGFRIDSLETSYLLDTPKILGFNYRGIARAA